MVVVNEAILEMIKKGISLNNISKLTGLGKSTLYFHYKKIKGRKIPLIKINLINPEDLGEFLGVFAGDGNFYKTKQHQYIIRIYIGYYEKHYADYLKNKLIEWFGKKPKYYIKIFNGKPSLITLYYSAKPIYSLIKEHLVWEGTKKTYSVRLKSLKLEDKKFNSGFLRGLIDTDGSYYSPKKRLSFSTVSEKLSFQASKIIESLSNIKPKLYISHNKGEHVLYTLTLHGENAHNLINIIKPKNINKHPRQ